MMEEHVNQTTGEVTLGVTPAGMTSADSAGPELYTAIVRAQADARSVGRDSKNQHHGYRYASAEAVIDEARQALGSASLALLTLGWSLEPEAGRESVGRVHVRYRLAHSSGQHLDIGASTPVVPGKGRPEDKAELGALTANLAYMLRGLLLLPRAEEASVDARDDREYRGRGREPEREPESERQRRNDRDDDAREREAIQSEPRRATEADLKFPPGPRGTHPGDDGKPPAKTDKQSQAELVDAYIDSCKKLELDFGYAGPDERMKLFRELEAIPQHLLDLHIGEADLDRARKAYNPIARAMKAALGIGKEKTA